MKEETKCYCGHTSYCDCGPETIEEALLEDIKFLLLAKSYASAIRLIEKYGYNKQQERSYSEEDMIAIFHYGHQVGMNSILAIQSQSSPKPIEKPNLEKLKIEWFEQFKNK